MEKEPLVLAVMLTADRPEMTARAVRSFDSQTYDNKKLFVLDTGKEEIPILNEGGVYSEYFPGERGKTIGTLRNFANRYSNPKCLNADIIVHWDSDDWSHPNRIAEQVSLLQASGKQVVGYRDLLFWRVCPQCHGFDDYCADVMSCETCNRKGGEAWIYSNNDPRFCLGTSLCYWRTVWEAKPFPDCPKPGMASGEDHLWLRDLERYGASVLGGAPINSPMSRERTRDRPLGPNAGFGVDPRMVASIHGGNSSDQYADIAKSSNWRRAAEWDEVCRKTMSL